MKEPEIVALVRKTVREELRLVRLGKCSCSGEIRLHETVRMDYEDLDLGNVLLTTSYNPRCGACGRTARLVAQVDDRRKPGPEPGP